MAWMEPRIVAIGPTERPMPSNPRKMNLARALRVLTGSSATSERTFMAMVMASSEGCLEYASMTDTRE